MFSQKTAARIVAEFIGAAVLSLALYTVLARTAFPIFTGTAVGVAIGLLVMVFSQASGGHFNPAITLGLWTRNKIGTVDAIVNIAAQFLGGVAAWGLIRYFMAHTLTSLAGPKFAWTTFFGEALGTGIFVMGVSAAVYMRVEGAKLGAAVGLSLFTGVLVASLGSNNAILNPAVALGVQSWDWSYAVAPLVGGIVGANVYALVFASNWASLTKKPAATKVTAKASGRSTAKKRTTKRK